MKTDTGLYSFPTPGATYGVPAPIDDPAILGEIVDALETVGYPKRAG